ncbi:hypothetical protein GCM10027212_18140 [Actinotalea caeni]
MVEVQQAGVGPQLGGGSSGAGEQRGERGVGGVGHWVLGSSGRVTGAAVPGAAVPGVAVPERGRTGAAGAAGVTNVAGARSQAGVRRAWGARGGHGPLVEQRPA